MNADVIIPLCAVNEATLYIALTAIRTCQASTAARILVLCNNTPDPRYRKLIEGNCRLPRVRFHYVDGPFSTSRCFNLGRENTNGEYIAYGSQDLIFYPNWLENIVDLWREHPEYWTLSNWTFDTDAGHPCASNVVLNERRIVDTPYPSSGVLVMRRSYGYVWDEQFPLRELDADLYYYMKSHGLRAGYCLNARCDHMIGGVQPHIDHVRHMGYHTTQDDSRQRLERKWNLPPAR